MFEGFPLLTNSTMKAIFSVILAFLTVSAMAQAQEVKIGDTEEQVRANTSGYIGAIDRGSSKTLFFRQGEITLVDGKVAKIGWRKKKGGGEQNGPIKDPTVARAIRHTLGKASGELTEADLLKLRKLEITPRTKGSMKARNLFGLEKAINLYELKLSHNSLTNIVSLEGLKNLRTLHIDGNQDGRGGKGSIDSLKPIGQLRYLAELRVSHYEADSVDALKDLAYVRELSVTHCRLQAVKDLGALADSVETLNLSHNHIADISGLAKLAKLESLRLDGNSIADVKALAGLPKLRDLRIADNAIVDVSPLAKLPELATLFIGGNQIVDVSPFADFPRLSTLNLDRNPLEDFTPLTGNRTVKSLSLMDTKLDAAADSKARGMVEFMRRQQIVVRFPPAPKPEEKKAEKADAPADDKPADEPAEKGGEPKESK